jgi:hypothetical protein
MSYIDHQLGIRHSQRETALTYGTSPIDSDAEVNASGSDLVAVWQEALRRMPSDLHQALDAAMERNR